MKPDQRRCGAPLADGTACQEPARVLGVQYVYDEILNRGGAREHELREIRYSVACPKCGLQKHIEQADRS
jgi:hypothetical protein